MKRFFRPLPLCIILMVFVIGCTQEIKDETVSIKVLYYGEFSFNSDYANAFRSLHPNIQLELVDMTGTNRMSIEGKEAFEDLIENRNPDVLLLNSNYYEKLSAEGKLYGLDELIKKSDYSIESMHPGVLQVLRTLGNNQLYGLAPTFTSSAIVYNKDLFNQYEIEYPTDQMTWGQVLELAERFPNQDENGDRLYGLTLQPWQSTPGSLLSLVNGTNGLNEIDTTEMKLMMDSDLVRNNAEMVLKAFSRGAIQFFDMTEDLSNYIDEMPFVNEQSAMFLGDLSFLNMIDSGIEYKKISIDWDLVTEPIDPRNPDKSVSFALNDIFAINVNSPHVEAAWEFIKYVNSEDAAELKSKSSIKLLSRTGQVMERSGHSLEAFYKLTFSVPPVFDPLPTSFYKEYSILKSQQFDEVLNNKKSLEEALNTIQVEGQTLLEFSLLQAKQE